MTSKYTAVVDFKRRGVFQEQVWLEEIRATSTRVANNKAVQKAVAYMEQQKGETGAPDGFEVIMCIRSSQLKLKNKQSAIIPLAPKLPPPEKNKDVVTVTRITPNRGGGVTVKAAPKKFDTSNLKKECRGDFSSPYKFTEGLLLRSGVTYGRFGHRGF